MQRIQDDDEQLERLARQVDQQLQELTGTSNIGNQKSEVANATAPTLAKQRAVIEQATGQPAETFWLRYKQAARKDLCQEGGTLHRHWDEWRDLRSKDAVKVSLGLMTGLGISGTALPAVAVAATVILLNIVVNIGIQAICDDDADAAMPD